MVAACKTRPSFRKAIRLSSSYFRSYTPGFIPLLRVPAYEQLPPEARHSFEGEDVESPELGVDMLASLVR